jgi:hypothetical protein
MRWTGLLLSGSGLILGCGGRSTSHETFGGSSENAGTAAAAGGAGSAGLGGAAGLGNGAGFAGHAPTCSDWSGTPLDSTSCRSAADCSSFEECLAQGDAQGCGICTTPDRVCETSSDCMSGFVCLEYAPPCPCPPGALASHCQPACTSVACDAGTRCNDTTGLCEPIPCSDGYACPVSERCGGEASAPDEHGCEKVPCTDDTNCACGACVNGTCAPGPGQCEPFPL